MRLIWRIGVASAVIALCSLPAAASIKGADMDVLANVDPACSITTTPVNFGSIDPTQNVSFYATGSIEVNCTAGTGWTAGAGAGEHPRILGTTFFRRMEGQNSPSPAQLAYNLYIDPAHVVEWKAPNEISGTGTGTVQSVPVYGEIGPAQTATPVDSYQDTVVVALEY